MIIIRKAVPEDANELVRLRVAFLNEVNNRTSAPDGYERDLEQYFRTSIVEESHIAWLAEEEGSIVATSGMNFSSIAPNYSNPSGKVAYIQNMFTLPEYRRRGLASELFGRLIEEARERGCKKLSLHATAAGRKVYEKFGFKGAEDEMVMKLD